jgi:hypothetical protein
MPHSRRIAPSQKPRTFRGSGRGVTGRADPLVRAGRPRPALLPKHQVSATGEEPAGGPAADQGVRPTTYAGVSGTQTASQQSSEVLAK